VLQLDEPLVRGRRLLERRERVVVEDRAVLVDLDERRSPVVGGRPNRGGVVAVSLV